MGRVKTRMRGIVAVLSLIGLLTAATPALAHHKAGHDGGSDNSNASDPKDKNPSASGSQGDHDGDADSDPNTSYTEDNDDDGRANDDDPNPSRHPSGNDKYVENGKSGNQGRSESNPDDSKGPQRFEGGRGPDKPNGPGGTDIYDQDGNNGCGNDQDFDDDNNGWCGRNPKRGGNGGGGNGGGGNGNGGGGPNVVVTGAVVHLGGAAVDTGGVVGLGGVDDAGVEGAGEDVQGRVDEAQPGSTGGVKVLPQTIARAAQAAVGRVAASVASLGGGLPFTGAANLLVLTAIAGLLMAGGLAAGALGTSWGRRKDNIE